MQQKLFASCLRVREWKVNFSDWNIKNLPKTTKKGMKGPEIDINRMRKNQRVKSKTQIVLQEVYPKSIKKVLIKK